MTLRLRQATRLLHLTTFDTATEEGRQLERVLLMARGTMTAALVKLAGGVTMIVAAAARYVDHERFGLWMTFFAALALMNVDRHRLRPAVIKVDVEGAELGVFRGARRTLARHRPVVISELWRRTEANRDAGEEVLTLFRQLDYHVTVPFEPGVRPGVEEIGEILCIPQGQGSPE